jgi:uncharacterized protein YgbK (DUF1537 family)
VLVVAGSRHQATARQIATARQRGVPIVCPPQALIDDPSASIELIAAEVAGCLAAHGSTVLTTVGLAPSSRPGSSVAARLAQIATAPAVRRCVGGLVLTGGDVAAAVCAGLGTATIWLGGEIAPGLPWGTLEGSALPGVPVVTKAGSFGTDGSLLRCLGRLAGRPEPSQPAAHAALACQRVRSS